MNYFKSLNLHSLPGILIFLSFILYPSALLHAGTVIKFATLAPEGSTWMKEMRAFTREVVERTSETVKFKIYAGGVSGDEKDVIRKIRIGQLHAGGFSGVGLGEIAREVRVLDAPFLFKTADEVDHIYKTFDPELRGALESKGYVLLGWAEVGFIYLYTNSPVHSPEDLKPVKMWMWEGDPIAEAAFKAIGITPIPLSIVDVQTSLQTGMVNGVYGSPLAVVAFQWFTKTKYMFTLPIANASGAVLVSKRIFDKLSKAHQKILMEAGARHFRSLTVASRRDNERSIATLKKEGITLTDPASEETVARFKKMGADARKSLVGRLYSKELLEKIEKAITDFRKTAAGHQEISGSGSPARSRRAAAPKNKSSATSPQKTTEKK